ncbi:MAG TPA: dephospho-CoA kinase [Alphaproteobacteria bacterium]|jgi:dephospho-CoA kinase
MIVIGITGSIGMGKSTAAAMFMDMGIPVHDSDACVHELMAPGGVATEAVLDAFPGCGNSGDGINRKALRAVLGSDHAQWDKLEAILHPLVQESQQVWLRAQKSLGVKMAALDIPLLFETGAEKRCDYTICMTAPDFVQRQRVLKKMSEADFEFRLSRQMPDADKRARADYVVQSGAGKAEMRSALEAVVRAIRNHGKLFRPGGHLSL